MSPHDPPPAPGHPLARQLSAVGIWLLSVGLAGVFLRRTPVGMLLSVQVMLGGVSLAFTAGDRYFANADGQILGVVVMATTLAQVALGLALVVRVARHRAGGRGAHLP